MNLRDRSIWPTIFGCLFLIGVILLIFTLGTSEVPEDDIAAPPSSEQQSESHGIQ